MTSVHKSTMLTINNCFESDDFIAWWNQVEDENGNQGWDDDFHLEFLVDLYNTSYSPFFAYEYIRDNVFDDEFPSVYD